MTISNVWDTVCALLNVRLVIIWVLEMRSHTFM